MEMNRIHCEFLKFKQANEVLIPTVVYQVGRFYLRLTNLTQNHHNCVMKER